MAYIITEKVDEINVSSITLTPFDNYEEDDYEFIFYRLRDFLNPTITGFTQVGTYQQDERGTYCVFYRRLTASESNYTVNNGSNGQNTFSRVLVRGVDTTNPIESFDFDLSTSPVSTLTMPSITTTTNNCLIFRGMSTRDVGNNQHILDDLFEIGSLVNLSNNNNARHRLYVQVQGSAGVVPSTTINATASDEFASITLAINSSNATAPKTYKINGTMIDTVANSSATVNNMTVIDTTIDGETVINSTVTLSNESIGNTVFGRALITNIPTSGGWIGFTLSYGTSINLSNKIIYYAQRILTYNNLLSELYLFLKDSGGNYVGFALEQYSNLSELIYSFYVSTSNIPSISSGTVDLTDIVSIAVGINKNNFGGGDRELFLTYLSYVDNYNIVGGTVDNPISIYNFSEVLNNDSKGDNILTQGASQTVYKPPIRIGNGLTPTYFSNVISSIETTATVNRTVIFDELSSSFELYGSANDVYDFSSSIVQSETTQNFIINDLSSSSATYNFEGCILIGWLVSWSNNVLCNGATFRRCDVVDFKGATVTNTNIRESISTTSAVSLSDGGDIQNSSFIKSIETYAIEITEAGDYNLSNTTFSGYTDELNVSASSGIVNITLSSTDTEPNYISAGATVNFLQPATTYTLQLPNILNGSRYQIYNVTQNSEIVNELVSGGSGIDYEMTSGVDYSAGDLGRVRVTYQNGTSAKLGIEREFVFPANTGTNEIPLTQEDDIVYNTIGIDGSTINKFSPDYVDTEVDLVVSTDFLGHELYSFFTNTLMSEQGIRLFYGAFIAEDIANFKVITSRANIFLDNTTTDNLKQTDNVRIYRDDGVYPVKNPSTGGGGIDVVWRDKVFSSSPDLSTINKSLLNRQKIDTTNNTLTIYDDDGITPFRVFDLKDSTGAGSSTTVFERDPQ